MDAQAKMVSELIEEIVGHLMSGPTVVIVVSCEHAQAEQLLSGHPGTVLTPTVSAHPLFPHGPESEAVARVLISGAGQHLASIHTDGIKVVRMEGPPEVN